VSALLVLAGCSPAEPTPQPPPVPDPPTITCPAPVTQISATGLAIPVVYGTPSVVNGASPVTTSCTPVSGSTFSIGTTSVTCTAIDTRQRTSSCAFPIQVQTPARIALTKFMAFGDSITRGEDGNQTLRSSPNYPPGLSFPSVFLIGREYPTVLQQLLSARYSTQQFIMLNAGEPQERAGDPAALSRFTSLAMSRVYEVALLMEGSNDIYGGTGGNPLGIPPAIANLRRMIGVARTSNVRVFLATVPPMNPAGSRGVLGYQTVPALNAELRLLALSEGVPLVDVFLAFNNNFTLLSADGLHPNAAGYELIGQTFFNSIRATLETAGPAQAPFLTPYPFFR
jgi:lysophospholipase L1-like esterase